jgi:hypothetical protein
MRTRSGSMIDELSDAEVSEDAEDQMKRMT